MSTPSSPLSSQPSYGLQRQLAVYMAGLEQAANAAMSREASGYLDGMPDVMRAHLEAFGRWRIVPRMLRNVAARDLSV